MACKVNHVVISGRCPRLLSHFLSINLFSFCLYVLFFHFRPCDVLQENCFFIYICIGIYIYEKTRDKFLIVDKRIHMTRKSRNLTRNKRTLCNSQSYLTTTLIYTPTSLSTCYSRLPLLRTTLGGRFSVRNSGVREKKKCSL